MTTMWLLLSTINGPGGEEEAATAEEARNMPRASKIAFDARVVRGIRIENTHGQEKFRSDGRGISEVRLQRYMGGKKFEIEDCRSALLFFFLFLDLDPQRFQELQILVVDLKFRIGRERSDEGSLVGGFFALLAHADGGFEDQKNIVAAFLDSGDDFSDLFGVR